MGVDGQVRAKVVPLRAASKVDLAERALEEMLAEPAAGPEPVVRDDRWPGGAGPPVRGRCGRVPVALDSADGG